MNPFAETRIEFGLFANFPQAGKNAPSVGAHTASSETPCLFTPVFVCVAGVTKADSGITILQVIHSVAHYIISSIVQGLWLQVLLILLCDILED